MKEVGEVGSVQSSKHRKLTDFLAKLSPNVDAQDILHHYQLMLRVSLCRYQLMLRVSLCRYQLIAKCRCSGHPGIPSISIN